MSSTTPGLESATITDKTTEIPDVSNVVTTISKELVGHGVFPPAVLENTNSFCSTSSDALPPVQADNNDGSRYPDGGRDAWLTVAGSTIILFAGFRVVNAFGAFQTFYEEDFLNDYKPSTISIIGSLQLFLDLFGG